MHIVMSRKDFAEMLAKRTGAFPAGMLTKTQPKVRKTGNPFPNIVRTTRRNVFLGGSYESIVNNAQERQGGERDFTAQELPWGKAVNRFFIAHKDRLYLRYFPVASNCKGEETWTTSEGIQVPYEAIQPFLAESKPSNEVGVSWRTVALDNVHEVTMDGDEIALVD